VIRRPLIVTLALASGALSACGTTDLLGDEVDAQRDKVETVIKDPAGAADKAAQEELKKRGIDGSAPPLTPGE